MQDRKHHAAPANYILTPQQVREIKTALAAKSKTGVVLAAEYGVSRPTISAIKKGRFHTDIAV